MVSFPYRHFRRTLRLGFHTSSVDKLLQARLLFSSYGYTLGLFSGSQEPYDEDYSGGSQNLLAKAVSEIRRQVASPFFIEDTSIRIDALSDVGDFPGLRAKEWFASTTFGELDDALRIRGDDRRATVKSDIALSIPGVERAELFHGETTGTVVAAPVDFEENGAYPWLTPRTFNGWFVPDEQNTKRPLVLGQMAYESSLEFDFRVRSLTKLLERYDQYNAVLNAPPPLVDARSRNAREAPQLSFLLEPSRPVLCVIGAKCAGKTTLANMMLRDPDAVHIEASTLFRELEAESGLTFSSDEEVLRFLASKHFDAVAGRVLDQIEQLDRYPVVVTGLRTPEEIALLARHLEDLVIVNVVADDRVRYERHLDRRRDPDLDNYESFRTRDEIQRHFGALRIAADIADVTISNDGTLGEYAAKVAQLWSDIATGELRVKARSEAMSESLRSLQALEMLDQRATCEEIADQTGLMGPQ
jgi:dephospho-CoA kinase/inosine/xanthosine triphosphate pyrophosphatase family protein